MKELFFPKVTSKRRITAVQHTAKPSASPPLKKLPLLLLPPTWHQGGRATFLPTETAQPTYPCQHPLLRTPKAEAPSPGDRSCLPPDLHGGALGEDQQHGVEHPGGNSLLPNTDGVIHLQPSVSLHQDLFFSVAKVVSLV